LLQSSDIYVMALDGETLAASNFDTATSFVGENFEYRPYFQVARDGGLGRYFALGTTSLKRGYYFAAPVRVEQAIKGVVVFKVSIDKIEQSWSAEDHEIVVTDPNDIVFMAGRAQWLFNALGPLPAERRSAIEASRQYADADIGELPVAGQEIVDGHDLMAIDEAGARREYLVLAEAMPKAGWTVKVLLDTAWARSQAASVLVVALLVLALAAMAAAIVLQRRARMAERLTLQREAHDLLERRVEMRTAELNQANTQLEREVAERRVTEEQLRKTQTDLVQAGKLAALGQMSAALSHEFNQPLAAVKTYAENAAVLIERGRVNEAGENISRISSLTDRMASISRHLRNFARKPNQKLSSVPLDEVAADALEIVGGRLRAAGVNCEIDLGTEPLAVRAGSVRLQQVLVNLIGNAVDASEGAAARAIEVSARRSGKKVRISVRDHGPGIKAAIAERIFDPFFTTKGVGKGLGLGLSISYNIVKDFGGSLSAHNHENGGAVFEIELDAAKATVREPAR
jgi:two-component system C4-dicarboxylate transport sensor histidine kinase DctB